MKIQKTIIHLAIISFMLSQAFGYTSEQTGGSSSTIYLSNLAPENHGADWRVTLSPATTAGNALTITHNLTTSASTIPSGVDHPMACFPNTKDNKLDDGETVNGWLWVFTATDTTTDESTLNYTTYYSTLTRNGNNCDYAYVGDVVTTNWGPAGGTFDGTRIEGSVEISDSQASDIYMSLNMESAICFFAKDTSFDTGSVWGLVDLASINLDPNTVMINYSGNIGGENSSAYTLAIFSSLLLGLMANF